MDGRVRGGGGCCLGVLFGVHFCEVDGRVPGVTASGAGAVWGRCLGPLYWRDGRPCALGVLFAALWGGAVRGAGVQSSACLFAL